MLVGSKRNPTLCLKRNQWVCASIFLKIATFSLASALLLIPTVSTAADQYSYESLGGYVGGYIYNQFMRDATAMHCPLSGSTINVKSDNDVVAWAVKLFPPHDKEKAATGLRASLPDLRNQAYSQARNIFVGFIYKNNDEKQRLCRELKRTIEDGERENHNGIKSKTWSGQ